MTAKSQTRTQTNKHIHTHKQSKHETNFSSKRYIGKGPRLSCLVHRTARVVQEGRQKLIINSIPQNYNLSEQPGTVMLCARGRKKANALGAT